MFSVKADFFWVGPVDDTILCKSKITQRADPREGGLDQERVTAFRKNGIAHGVDQDCYLVGPLGDTVFRKSGIKMCT